MIGSSAFLKSVSRTQDSFKCKVALDFQNIYSPAIGDCVYIGKIVEILPKSSNSVVVIELRNDFDFGWEPYPGDNTLRSDKRYWTLPAKSLVIKDPSNILSTE